MKNYGLFYFLNTLSPYVVNGFNPGVKEDQIKPSSFPPRVEHFACRKLLFAVNLNPSLSEVIFQLK